MRHLSFVVCLLSTLTAGMDSLGAQSFFDTPRHGAPTPERYRTPIWGELEWRPSPVAETLIASAGVYEMALAVGSNFTGEEPPTPRYVRAMGLAIADRLNSGAKRIRLADYQLKHRRQPDEVARWSEREPLAAALWKSAWRVHGADQATGLTLLDLAAAFDPSDAESIARYQTLSEEKMEGRWLAAVRLPDGIDAPDINGKPVDAAAVLAEIAAQADATKAGAPAPAPPTTKPIFQIRNTSLHVPAADGGVARLIAEVVEYDAATLRERKQMMIRQRKQEAKRLGVEAPPYQAPALEMDFRTGTANANASAAILKELAKARAAFVRGRPGFDFPAGLGVEFEIADGRAPVTGGVLSAAAGVLLESMSQGIALADEAGAMGQLGFGSKFQLGETPLSGTLNTSGQSVRFAVPVTAGADAADLAALGELGMLLNVQLLACRDVNHAMQLLGEESNDDRDRALELFAEIGHAANRTPAEALVRNPLVRARLAEVLELCPEHLSAATLLKASSATKLTASLTGSARRLRDLERSIREQVDLLLTGTADASDSSDENCATSLADLRFLRPRLHPETRNYADGISDLIEDLRDSLGRGASLSARRAESLRRSLDSLAVQVATLGIAEPR